MLMRQKSVNIVLLFVMILSLMATVPFKAQSQPATTVNVGDYIQFGKYNGQPILWKVVDKDSEGNPLLISDRIITFKAYDAAGSFYPSISQRFTDGSNYYPDSNIRQWLNSSSPNSGEDVIDWVQNDPNSTNLKDGENAYATEKGFLADGNFTAYERSLIMPYVHKIMIMAWDKAKSDGGKEQYFDLITSDNFDSTAFYKHIIDHVLLFSDKQIKEYQVYSAKATAEALANSPEPHPLRSSGLTSTTDTLLPVWLNTFANNSACALYNGVCMSNVTPDNARIGVRPALQMNLEGVQFAENSAGTEAEPYVIAGSSVEESSPPAMQDLVLSTDSKTLKVQFDQPLSDVNKSNISIVSGNSPALLPSAFNSVVNGDYLEISQTNSKATFKSGTKVTIGAGSVRSLVNRTVNLAQPQKTLSVQKFVSIASVEMTDNTNSQALLTFNTMSKGVSTGTVSLNPIVDDLRDRMEYSEDNGKTWTTGVFESVSLSSNTIQITWTGPIFKKSLIRFKPRTFIFTGAGKDNGVFSPELKSPFIDLALFISKFVTSKNKDTLTITFSEPITNAVDTVAGSTTNLIAGLGISLYGTENEFEFTPQNFSSAKVSKSTLVIKFAPSSVANFVTNTTKLRLNSNLVQDKKLIKSKQFTFKFNSEGWGLE